LDKLSRKETQQDVATRHWMDDIKKDENRGKKSIRKDCGKIEVAGAIFSPDRSI
jgi:hypothetical protein